MSAKYERAKAKKRKRKVRKGKNRKKKRKNNALCKLMLVKLNKLESWGRLN